MNQQALAQELTALINAGLKQRTVPIDRPAWVLGYTDIDGWVVSHQAQPNPRFPQGVPLGFDQLIVFRELLEIEPILDRLPPLRLADPLRPGFLETADPRAILEQVIIDVDVALDPGTSFDTLQGFALKASLKRLRDFLPVR